MLVAVKRSEYGLAYRLLETQSDLLDDGSHDLASLILGTLGNPSAQG